jgi:predicted DNA-binding transcriptional regulator AlpA
MTSYITRKQVAQNYPISFSTLAHMASDGRGPKYRIVGKSAIYRIDEIEFWLEQQVVEFSPRRENRKRGRPRKQPTSRLVR